MTWKHIFCHYQHEFLQHENTYFVDKGLSGLYTSSVCYRRALHLSDHSGWVWVYIYSSFSLYNTSRPRHELRLLGTTSWWKAILSGLDNGIFESSQNSKPMKTYSQSLSLHTGYSSPSTVWAHALLRCSHCHWCLGETQTPAPAFAQVQHGHLY